MYSKHTAIFAQISCHHLHQVVYISQSQVVHISQNQVSLNQDERASDKDDQTLFCCNCRCSPGLEREPTALKKGQWPAANGKRSDCWSPSEDCSASV